MFDVEEKHPNWFVYTICIKSSNLIQIRSSIHITVFQLHIQQSNLSSLLTDRIAETKKRF